MQAFLEILVSFLAAAGLLSVGWLLFGRLFLPVGAGRDVPVYVIIRAEGNAAGLEQTVGGLLWLNKGELAALRIVIADAGLSAQGRQTALQLAERGPRVCYCPLDLLPDYIKTCS